MAVNLFNDGDYVSEFEGDSEAASEHDRESLSGHTTREKKQDDLFKKPKPARKSLPTKSQFVNEQSEDEWRRSRQHFLSLDAYSRHKKMVNDYLRFYGGNMNEFKRDTSTDRTDLDVIRDNHRFIWEPGEDSGCWEKRISKKYWDKLFKEYGIADLSRYRENKIGMRWRIESEVVTGKGQFVCGARKCTHRESLRSWEVNFSYVEAGVKKNTLVKVRLCPECSMKLNYHSKKREVKRKKRKNDAAESEKGNEGDEPLAKRSTSSKSSETSESSRTSESESPVLPPGATEDVWKMPAPILDEKSRDDEFEEYFEDMFL